MKSGKFILLPLVIGLVIAFTAASAFAASNASILYTETELDGSLWKYDYIFQNNTTTEYLYGIRLYLGDSYNVSSTSLPAGWSGAWGIKSNTSFMATHTFYPDHDIDPESDRDGFSFTIDSQIGDVSYDAYFYDSQGTTSSASGTTFVAQHSPPVVPEPVSSVLFITGGAALALRKRFKRKK